MEDITRDGKRSSGVGAKGMTAWQVFILAILRMNLGKTFDELEFDFNHNALLRQFLEIWVGDDMRFSARRWETAVWAPGHSNTAKIVNDATKGEVYQLIHIGKWQEITLLKNDFLKTDILSVSAEFKVIKTQSGKPFFKILLIGGTNNRSGEVNFERTTITIKGLDVKKFVVADLLNRWVNIKLVVNYNKNIWELYLDENKLGDEKVKLCKRKEPYFWFGSGPKSCFGTVLLNKLVISDLGENKKGDMV